MLKMIEVLVNDAERIADMLEQLAHLQRIMGDRQYNRSMCYAKQLREKVANVDIVTEEKQCV